MEAKISLYTKLYEQLRRKLKWKITSNQTLMTISSIYVMNEHPFNFSRFHTIAETIKQRSGVFSPLRSESRFTIASMLDVNFNQPEQQVENIFNLYKQLVSYKFQRSIFTYIAATILVTKIKEEKTDIDKLIMKAKQIYDGMKNKHRFLTSAEDYPLAILLAFKNDVHQVIEESEFFYEKLNKNGFRSGNHLQFLSHILALHEEENNEKVFERVIHVYDTFKYVGIKRKASYYPIMGILTHLPSKQFIMEEVTAIYNKLNSIKAFRWQKDFNLMLAVSFIVKEKLTSTNIAETSLFTTLETILQAQEAAIIAASSAVIISSNNNSN